MSMSPGVKTGIIVGVPCVIIAIFLLILAYIPKRVPTDAELELMEKAFQARAAEVRTPVLFCLEGFVYGTPRDGISTSPVFTIYDPETGEAKRCPPDGFPRGLASSTPPARPLPLESTDTKLEDPNQPSTLAQ